MKKLILYSLAMLVLAACNGIGNIDETQREWSVDDNKMTWGLNEYTISGSLPNLFDEKGRMISEVPSSPTAWVTFLNNPEGYNEFATVYQEFLGKSPMGAAAMIPMAMELYGRNRPTGEKCFQLLCGTPANANTIIRILDTKFPRLGEIASTDSYLQRYLPAALLKGARAENAYTPDEPYTVQMLPSANAPTGLFTHLYIFAEGWDTYLRAVEIKQNGDHYIVSQCPACYSQCKYIQGDWSGLK